MGRNVDHLHGVAFENTMSTSDCLLMQLGAMNNQLKGCFSVRLLPNAQTRQDALSPQIRHSYVDAGQPAYEKLYHSKRLHPLRKHAPNSAFNSLQRHLLKR